MNEKNKLIKKIMGIEKQIFIRASLSTEEELQKRDTDNLKKYYRSCEIVKETSKNIIPDHAECSKCGRFLAKIEAPRGICYDCEGKKWF
jgi:hypothetical protein